MKCIVSLIVTISTLNFCTGQKSDSKESQIWHFSNSLSMLGDFDGDGEEESIFCKSISKNTNEQIIEIEYEDESDLFNKYCAYNPKLILYSDNSDLSEYTLTDSCRYRTLQGISLLGDINGDGGDEVAICYDWFGDAVPAYFIVLTYCNDSWIVVDEFELYFDTWSDGYISVDIDKLIERDENFVGSTYIGKNGAKVKIKVNEDGC